MGRLHVCALVLTGLIAGATPGRAQHVGPDGFSICPFSDSALGIMRSNIGPCQPLTDQAMQNLGLSASQKGIVATLQSFVAKPSVELLQRMANEKSLAEPRQFTAAGDLTDDWLPDATEPGNVELGIHLRYATGNAKSELLQMTYTVDGNEGHFTVLWNRVLAAPSR